MRQRFINIPFYSSIFLYIQKEALASFFMWKMQKNRLHASLKVEITHVLFLIEEQPSLLKYNLVIR